MKNLLKDLYNHKIMSKEESKAALISLTDKSNLKPLLQELKRNNIKIISSGGTFKIIKKSWFSRQR